MNYPYIGNGAYCYANSASMLLGSIGEDILPSLIEVLSGTGLSATVEKSGFLFLNNQCLEPDLGIISALKILGFEADVSVCKDKADFPFDELKQALAKQAVILGPLDMGYLVYNPNHKYLHGSDHFVMAYKAEEDKVYLHDPAGFPNVIINKDDLQKSWQAEKIVYKQGYYRFITNVKRISAPSKDDIYQATVKRFINIYQEGEAKTSNDMWRTGSKALLNTKERLEEKLVSQQELNNFVYFVFPLGARRALDFAAFFGSKDPDLANLKRQQANLLGEAHTLAVAKNFNSLGNVLEQLADSENKFRTALLDKIG